VAAATGRLLRSNGDKIVTGLSLVKWFWYICELLPLVVTTTNELRTTDPEQLTTDDSILRSRFTIYDGEMAARLIRSLSKRIAPASRQGVCIKNPMAVPPVEKIF